MLLSETGFKARWSSSAAHYVHCWICLSTSSLAASINLQTWCINQVKSIPWSQWWTAQSEGVNTCFWCPAEVSCWEVLSHFHDFCTCKFEPEAVMGDSQALQKQALCRQMCAHFLIVQLVIFMPLWYVLYFGFGLSLVSNPMECTGVDVHAAAPCSQGVTMG